MGRSTPLAHSTPQGVGWVAESWPICPGSATCAISCWHKLLESWGEAPQSGNSQAQSPALRWKPRDPILWAGPGGGKNIGEKAMAICSLLLARKEPPWRALDPAKRGLWGEELPRARATPGVPSSSKARCAGLPGPGGRAAQPLAQRQDQEGACLPAPPDNRGPGPDKAAAPATSPAGPSGAGGGGLALITAWCWRGLSLTACLSLPLGRAAAGPAMEAWTACLQRAVRLVKLPQPGGRS